MNFLNKHILNDFVFKKYEIFVIQKLKNKYFNLNNYNKNICIINDKNSLRTINTLTNLLNLLNIKYTQINNIHNYKKEDIKDLSRILGLNYDYIFYRGYNDLIFKTIAKWSGSVVYNLLSNNYHPIQALSDVLLCNKFFFYIGNSNTNVCKSLIIILSKINKVIIIMSPFNCWKLIFLKKIFSKRKIILTEKIIILKKKISLYTDSWFSMGETNKNKNDFLNYKIKSIIFSILKVNNILHCLPCTKNNEIEVKIFESKFIIFDKQVLSKYKIFKSILILNEKLFFNIRKFCYI